MRNTSPKTDDELIEAHFEGDSEALPALIDRHLGGVYRFALRLVGKQEDAEDIAQETFLKAWRSLERFRKGANFKTWLFSIARNASIDHLRKKRPLLFGAFKAEDEEADFEQMLPDFGERPDEFAEANLRKEALEAALLTLPPLYREILALHYMEGLTLEESAQALGIPLNTAKSRDRRALIALRKLLNLISP